MKLRKSKKKKERCWVNFKYEAIHAYCFICGMIGHGEYFCDRVFDIPLENIEKPYGAWLRADPRRKTHTMGTKSLRNGGGVQEKNSGEKGEPVTDKDSPERAVETHQLVTKSGIIDHSSKIVKGEVPGIVKGNTERNKQIETYQPHIQNLNMNEEGENSGLDSLIVVDPKRHRMTLDQDKNFIYGPGPIHGHGSTV